MKNVKKQVQDDKKKLLYIMGIDWEWLFQRPQVIEQYLEQKYDVTVIFPRSILYLFKRTKGKYPKKFRILWVLPKQEKNKFIYLISQFFSRHIFRDISDFDAIIIGYPLYYRYISPDYKGRIIYDCIDNHEALYPDQKRVEKLIFQEKKLVENCSALFVTGTKLQKKMNLLINNKSILPIIIRNGTELDGISYCPFVKQKQTYVIGYFGTIAQWFDYQILIQSLKEINDIEYHIIGPITKSCEYTCERMVFEGFVNHQELYNKTKNYDCLIMPFIVDKVVEWVDPVKLYEYIAMGKCIISVKYEEVKHFEDFVYFYTGYKEFISLLKHLKSEGFPPKYTAVQQRKFLSENSWAARFKTINEVLDQVLHG